MRQEEGGVRISLTLNDLRQLNLVHRRLTRLAESGALVYCDELESLVDILDNVFGFDGTAMRGLLEDLVRSRYGNPPA